MPIGGSEGLIGASVGDLEALAASFRRHLRASNLSPRTVTTYTEACEGLRRFLIAQGMPTQVASIRDRKSTRLNSSHITISYAVFCLKKKKNNHINYTNQTKHNTKTPTK